MNTIPKRKINAAAKQHALSVLGKEQFSKNKDAVRSITEDFKSASEWTMKTLFELGVSSTDQGHDLIGKERMTAIVKGYDADHDDKHDDDRLVVMAILLAAEDTELEPFVKGLPWPQDGYPDKRGKLDQVRRLTIAGQFLAAAIDQAIRKASPAESEVTNV
ncbi:hypothetical protein [Mucilaginibacter sp.]|uniref:hypothetical protein n=1 Tax=Mucilaginibacter sp. TaxID=1882438 RepID=UPI0035BBCB65